MDGQQARISHSYRHRNLIMKKPSVTISKETIVREILSCRDRSSIERLGAKEVFMFIQALMALCVTLTLTLIQPLAMTDAMAKKYELTRNSVSDPAEVDSKEVSLYRVKLGDSEIDAMETLVNQKIPGVRVEQVGQFVTMWDQSNPTAPMAGVQITDGKVDLIFINNRFSHKTRGLFRRVLTSETVKEIRDLVGPEEYGDENLMGARLCYETKGFIISHLGRDINVIFTAPSAISQECYTF